MDVYDSPSFNLVNQSWCLFSNSTRTDVRRNAFTKLAALSSSSGEPQAGDIARLARSLARPKAQPQSFLDGMLKSIAPTSRVSMPIRELDILLALCKAAPALADQGHAEKLLSQLSNYLPEAHVQVFNESPYLHDIGPSPWEALTYQLSNALLSIGINHPALRSGVLGSTRLYLQRCAQSLDAIWSGIYRDTESSQYGDDQDAAEIASISVSLLGFMEAATSQAHFWLSSERLELLRQLQDILSERFLVAVETSSSTIRNSSHSQNDFRSWRKYLRRYAARGNPLGAMLLQKGFMRYVLACTSRLLANEAAVESGDTLYQYMAGIPLERAHDQEVDDAMIEYLSDIIGDQMRVLEDGSDYLQIGSAWQQRLAFLVKGYALEAFLHCMVIDEDIADAELLFGWLEDTLTNQVQMADENLADIVLKSLAVVAKYMPDSASNFARILLRFIVQGISHAPVVAIAAQSLSYILRILSQDAIITTLYSLGNVLSSGSGAEKTHHMSPSPDPGGISRVASGNNMRTASVISLSMSGDEETSVVCGNVTHAIVMIATSCNDPRITALAQTMILQKVGRINLVVDARILEEAAILAVSGKENEFRALLRFYARINHEAVPKNNGVISGAILKARNYLATHLESTSGLFKIYLIHLLERVITMGDVVDGDTKHPSEVEQAATEIAPLLKPLALLAAKKPAERAEGSLDDDEEVLLMAREAWFNIAVHGITLRSRLGQQIYDDLRVIALHSPPLVAEDRAESLESDVELNTILMRGMSPAHTAEQKKSLISVLPSRETDIKRLSYQKVVFLNAVFLVESLRAVSGNCSDVLSYFQDTTMKHSEMGICMTTIAEEVTRMYIIKALPAQDAAFAAPYVSKQLAKMLGGCCHRIEKVQQIAVMAADRIIALAPSALCQKSALFALLELLTIMWSSCLDAEIDEYEWKSTFISTRGKIRVDLSDDYEFRKKTLNTFYRESEKWVRSVMGLAPLDIKGLLQTYLSEYDDSGAYGHVALGRSFALDMGSMIPPLDQRLSVIDRRGEAVNVNVASDFMAQYTTRQEYRYAGFPDHDRGWLQCLHSIGATTPTVLRPTGANGAPEDAKSILHDLGERTSNGKYVSFPQLRDVLRRAAALLCRSKKSQTEIVYYLVNIPFETFSKASIKLGISLWLGVIHENPRMEPRILTEVAQAWERSIDRRVGLFNRRFKHLDPFYVGQEFAPSDKAALLKQQEAVQSTISPHLRALQFFESHFNAIRLGSPNTQRTFVRMITRTLVGLKQTYGHPLMREIQFHAVLFGLRILQFNTCLTEVSLWRLKDQIFSAALWWFTHPLSFSFGGNRIQMKAEVKVMADVLSALRHSEHIGASMMTNRKSLGPKQDLLEVLLQSEINRLSVWLSPLEHEAGRHIVEETMLAKVVRTAWTEDPALAIRLSTRFPSASLRHDLRSLLLNFPDRALKEADALDLLLGESLPHDVSFQLKYLLYWAPVNPLQAVTYFLPAYGNHPFILQYAIRALESHTVDVTFFYVPQIVQSLRYDALGYVERYIIETGKFSQLFAHQIIWNIKANAYKDEESQTPDPMKPTLDKVMSSLISSFSGPDKDFYEREFTFFGDVTDVSGKLKPFIKKSKPEKKQKIEEELRKIKVEVGVYLPSNPDGVVIGIDRKSGKPLQSHAKAPYMATFRIRKTRDDSNEEVSQMIETAPKHQHRRPKNTSRGSNADFTSIDGDLESKSNTYEVWQSAIFKVGDDCRQDVLVLQIIAAFRGIFNSVGLDVYVFPYRVTATAPGCGVIDVLPNSISRDMLGREAVNGLYDYFVTMFGGEDSVRFQEARANFVKSMAAYSVVCYLLQLKDRHNGNIMVDDKGHILHIDFGFCFDIAPGGVKFERAPFKLTPEMMAVMGGGSGQGGSQAYRWFEELTVKAFLASRPYCGKLCHLVSLMLDSGLPCFKPETMRNFIDRFVLEKSERDAAEFMKGCIKKSEGNYSTKVYDEFQLLTNGIPY